MQITLIHHQYALGGGMEAYLHNLIQELLRQNHQVTLWVNKVDSRLPVPQGLNLKVLRHKFLPKFLQKWYFAFALPHHLQKDQAEVIISTTRSLYQDITIVGGTHKGYLKSLKTWRLKDLGELWLEKEAYRRSKKIVAHSPMIRAELHELYHLPPEKMIMLYPPVDARKFTFSPHAPHQPFRLLFPSTSHKRKGGGLLLEAFKLLPRAEFELWIAGRSFREAEQLPNVKYLGFVDLSTVYREVDLMVLPSWFEPFGLVVVEALSSGVPVLISKFTAAKALVNQDEALILEEMTPPALADLLKQARTYEFKLKPNFIERHGLTIEDHVKALMEVQKRH
jgi:glycosyltransferase involved in cell wall biosynthesis